MLVLKNKKKTLEEIMPVWAERIEDCGGLLRAIVKHSADYSMPRMCLVGEAHGWTGIYKGANDDYCDECVEYCDISAKLTKITEREWIEGFLEHWNSVHVKE